MQRFPSDDPRGFRVSSSALLAPSRRIADGRAWPRRSALVLSAAPLLALLLAAPASAHHLMGFLHLKPGPISGLISGVMHPILGPDHLLFLLAIGLVGTRHRFRWVAGLLACGLLGAALGLALPGLGVVEPLVALSLVLVGLVLTGRLPAPVLVPAFLLHGYALSGSVIGWEPTPIAFYLMGLLLGQTLLLGLALTLVRRWGQHAAAASRTLVAGLLMGIGLAFAWAQVVP